MEPHKGDAPNYKTRGPEVIAFIEQYCLNPKTGKPLRLDQEQKDFITEFYLMEWDEEEQGWFYVYKNALRGEPRGGGKSTLAAALALFELSPLSFNQTPVIQLASASRGNTKYVFNPAREMVRLNPAFASEFQIFQNKNFIWCDKNSGNLEKLSADGKGNFGGGPDLIVRDELHTWVTEKQILLSEALITSLGKNSNGRCLTTSTAGSDKNSLLGKLYDQYLKYDDLERPNRGLTIARDRANKFLFWWWEAPAGMAIDDPVTWKIAHPASWIKESDIRAMFNDPNLSQDEFRRQWLNQWTKAAHSWFQVGVWRGLKSDAEIPQRARVQVAVDGSLVEDTTAVVYAHAADEDSPVIIRSHVWAMREELEHDTLVTGGSMDMDLVREYILHLAKDFLITEIVYDPRFFDATAKQLSRDGFTVPIFSQQGEQMNDATNLFYRLVRSAGITHNGDEVLTDHVEGVAAIWMEGGYWRIFKLRQTRKYDACQAAIMAVSRAKADLVLRNASYIYRRKEDGTLAKA